MPLDKAPEPKWIIADPAVPSGIVSGDSGAATVIKHGAVTTEDVESASAFTFTPINPDDISSIADTGHWECDEGWKPVFTDRSATIPVCTAEDGNSTTGSE